MKRKTAAKPASTRITLTLPNDLLAVLDDAAAADNRPRANFIAYFLQLLKETNPFLGKPRPPLGELLKTKTSKGQPGPCPLGRIRPCERNRLAAVTAAERTASHGK